MLFYCRNINCLFALH